MLFGDDLFVVNGLGENICLKCYDGMLTAQGERRRAREAGR
jgi:hypothetical protein